MNALTWPFAPKRSNLVVDTGLLEDGVGRGSFRYRHGNTEPLVADRALPNLMTAAALTDKRTAMLQKQTAQFRVIPTSHTLSRAQLFEAKIKLRIFAITKSVVLNNQRGNDQHGTIDQLLNGWRFSNQADGVAFSNQHVVLLSHLDHKTVVDKNDRRGNPARSANSHISTNLGGFFDCRAAAKNRSQAQQHSARRLGKRVPMTDKVVKHGVHSLGVAWQWQLDRLCHLNRVFKQFFSGHIHSPPSSDALIVYRLREGSNLRQNARKEFDTSETSGIRTRQFCGFFTSGHSVLAGRATDKTPRKGEEVHRLVSGINLPATSWGRLIPAPRVSILDKELDMNALTIGTSAVRQLDGLYSLNDLHKAAGGEAKHQPALFMRNDQAQALIEEIKSTDSQDCVKTVRGGQGGTYVCRELVYAYGMWISAKFTLTVIRAFDGLQKSAASAALPHYITQEQAGAIVALIAERFPEGKHRPYAWSRFANHFKLAGGPKGEPAYKFLPASRFDEALAYLAAMPAKEAPALPAPAPAPTPSSSGITITLSDLGGMDRALLTKIGPHALRIDFLPNEARILTSDEDLPALIKEPGQVSRALLPAIITNAASRLA